MDSHLAVLDSTRLSPSHRTLAEKAFDTLHTAIVTGQLRPGARLPIEELAERLEMSPMPIREAVRRLHAAGLVENIPHRGARVTELSVADLREVYEVRLALEALAIRRAAERFTTGHETRTRENLGILHQLSDDSSAATSAAHAAFHFALYDAADSGWLMRSIRPVWETSERYCLEFPQCRQLLARTAEHQELLDACVAGDPDWAAAALHDHLAGTANHISAEMDGEPLFELTARGGAAPRAQRAS